MKSPHSTNKEQVVLNTMPDGEPTYAELLLENALLKKQLADKKENEENYKLMVQHTLEPFFCFNPDETYRFVNDYFAQTLGLQPSDIIGKTPHAIFPYEEAEKRLTIVRNVLKSGETEDIEVKVVKPNGEEIYFVTTVNPIKDNQNTILWVSCISRNVTEQKRKTEESEQKYKLNEEKWKLIVNNSTDVLNLINEKGEQFFISESAEKITGFKMEEMLGPFAPKIHPDDLANVENAFYEIMTNKEKPIRIQYRHIHKEHDWIWLEAVGQNYLHNPAINAIVVNVRDISQIKEKENELIVAKEKAEESNRLKSAFLNNISHEVRTPLNAIIGFSELIVKTNQTPDNLNRYFDIISESSKRLIDVISDVIDISQLQSTKNSVNLSEFDIVKVANDIIADYKPRIKDKNLNLIFNMHPKYESFTIISDQDKLSKTIKHLVDNALKFTQQGSIQIDFSLSCEKLDFTITDTGIGISKEMQEIVFEPFTQMETGLSRNYGGNGVGLAIIKGYLHLLNGTLAMQSELNSGTKFHISIPLNSIQ